MDVHEPLALEADEQVLALGLGAEQRPAVERGRLVGEPALRARRRDRRPAKARVELRRRGGGGCGPRARRGRSPGRQASSAGPRADSGNGGSSPVVS